MGICKHYTVLHINIRFTNLDRGFTLASSSRTASHLPHPTFIPVSLPSHSLTPSHLPRALHERMIKAIVKGEGRNIDDVLWVNYGKYAQSPKISAW